MADSLRSLLRSCRLCPRHCAVDRTAGRTGFCGLDDTARIEAALPHFGEEPPLSGTGGSGTVFFTSCNLRCVFCQNHQISAGAGGKSVSRDDLAHIFLDLQRQGCHNINAVTPTPHLAPLLDALASARRQGLTLPLVYNSSGYEDAGVLRLLDGSVDIYLPDVKYGMDETGYRYSGVRDYVSRTTEALREMKYQVGRDLLREGGIAVRGLLVRHLVLPGQMGNSIAALDLIAEICSPRVCLSLMSQYTPTPSVRNDPLLRRRVTIAEYDAVVRHALALGFETCFLQDVSEENLVPDFHRDTPFTWGNGSGA